MERRWMKTGQVLAMVAIAASLAAVSRTSLNAQEPAKPSARQALRQRIADLRGEVALREVELETDREILKQKLMRVPIILHGVDDVRGLVRITRPVEKIEELDASITEAFVALAQKLQMPHEAIVRDLDKAIFEASKTKEPKAISKAILKWVNDAENWAKAEIEKEFAPLKKDFALHASELCLKKLEMEDLEKQYRDSR